MAFEQAMTMLEHARQSRWYAYVVVSLLTGRMRGLRRPGRQALHRPEVLPGADGRVTCPHGERPPRGRG